MYDVSDKAVNTKKNAVQIEKISASNMTKQKYDFDSYKLRQL